MAEAAKLPTVDEILGPAPAAAPKPTVDEILGPAQEDIDTTSGLPWTDQMALSGADNFDEKKAYLDNVYGAKNIYISPEGTIYVNVNGKPTLAEPPTSTKGVSPAGKPRYVGEQSGPFLKRLSAEAVAHGPEMIGMAGGAALGGAAGTMAGPAGTVGGAVMGAGAGAAVGKSAEELAKSVEGRLIKSPGQEAETIGAAGAGGMEAEMTGRLGGKIIKGVSRGLPDWLSGATKESRERAGRLISKGARPPLQSTAPDLRKLNRTVIIAQKISGGTNLPAEANRAVLERLTKRVMTDNGVPHSQVHSTYEDMRRGTFVELGEAPGEAVHRRVDAHAQMIEKRTAKIMEDATASVKKQEEHFDKLVSQHPVDGLGVNVAKGIDDAESQFKKEASENVYGPIFEQIGDQPVVDASPIYQMGERIVKLSKGVGTPGMAAQAAKLGKEAEDPVLKAATEQLFKDMGVEMPANGKGMITPLQAQRMRTLFRERARKGGIANVTKHEMGQLADAADESLTKAMIADNNLPGLTQLAKADAWYAENIKKFNNMRIRQIVQRFKRTGVVSDPSTITDLIAQSGETMQAAQFKEILPPDVWKQVQSQHISTLLESSKSAVTGEITASRLLTKIKSDRDMITFMHGKDFYDQLRRFGKNLAVVQGKLPASAATDAGLRQLMADYDASTKELDDFLKRDPIGALRAPKLLGPQIYARIVEPGNANLLVQAEKFLGKNSPEMRAIRETALRRILAGSVTDFNANIEMSARIEDGIYGNKERGITGYTVAQRAVLFPNHLDDVLVSLSKDMQFLFPQIIDQSMAGMEAGAKLGKPAITFGLPKTFGGKGLVGGRWYVQAMAGIGRWIINHPDLQIYLSGARESPTKFSGPKIYGGTGVPYSRAAQEATMQFARLFAAESLQQDNDQ